MTHAHTHTHTHTRCQVLTQLKLRILDQREVVSYWYQAITRLDLVENQLSIQQLIHQVNKI